MISTTTTNNSSNVALTINDLIYMIGELVVKERKAQLLNEHINGELKSIMEEKKKLLLEKATLEQEILNLKAQILQAQSNGGESEKLSKKTSAATSNSATMK